jgi:Chaperone of endosialidase
MSTSYTSLLGLALPANGELAGTWGDTVNNSITSLLDSAVAGTTTLSTDADVTLTTTTGASNQAREAILLCSGARTALRTITAPAQSKIYTIINATTGGFSVKIVGAGPTTGVTIVAGESALIAWNGSDFIKISSNSVLGGLTVTSLTDSGLTSGRVTYAGTSGLLQDSASMTFNGTVLTSSFAGPVAATTLSASSTVSGTGFSTYLASPPAIGGTAAAAGSFTTLSASSTTTLSGGTANGVAYLNGSKVLTTGTALVFDGANLGIGVTPSAYISAYKALEIGTTTGLYGRTDSLMEFALVLNCYRNSGGSWIYRNNGAAARYNQNLGAHWWDSAPSGTAGNAITFTQTMTLDASGNLLVGTTSAIEKLTVNGRVSCQWNAYANGGTTSYSGDATSLVTGSSAGMWAARSDSALLFSIGSNEQARIDSAGNLGLGVTPSAWSQGKAFEVFQAGYGLWNGTSSSYILANAYYNSGFKYGSAAQASHYYQYQGQHVWSNAPSGTAGNAITFTQAMTLDASGSLLVGTTSYSGSTNGNYLMAGAADGTFWASHASGTSSGKAYLNFQYNGTNIGSITQSGTTAVLYNVTSDQRLKENIVDAPEFGSVIDAIQVRSYDWKADGNHQRAGFIAQELVTVAPEAVHQPADPEDMMAVDYSKLVPMLVKEIQDLRKRLAAAGI